VCNPDGFPFKEQIINRTNSPGTSEPRKLNGQGANYGGDSPPDDDDEDTKNDYVCNPTVELSDPADCFLCSLQTHEQKGQQQKVSYSWNLANADDTLHAALKHLDSQDDACIDRSHDKDACLEVGCCRWDKNSSPE
jgi:hypothetical protein